MIGKEVILNDTVTTRVTGIVKDLDKNTDFKFKIFISLATLESRLVTKQEQGEWGNTNSASQLLINFNIGYNLVEHHAAAVSICIDFPSGVCKRKYLMHISTN